MLTFCNGSKIQEADPRWWTPQKSTFEAFVSIQFHPQWLPIDILVDKAGKTTIMNHLNPPDLVCNIATEKIKNNRHSNKLCLRNSWSTNRSFSQNLYHVAKSVMVSQQTWPRILDDGYPLCGYHKHDEKASPGGRWGLLEALNDATFLKSFWREIPHAKKG